MLNRTIFFDGVRTSLFLGVLSHEQVDGMTAILDEWERRKLQDLRWLGYILATAYHETAEAMQPVLETRMPGERVNPTVDVAIGRLERAWTAGKMPWVKTAYWRKNARGLSYLGRGYPQLTTEANYRRMSPYVGVDLVADPELALDPENAVTIMFEGMIRGLYTGHKLADYFSAVADDPQNARKIINALQMAATVAGYHRKFMVWLTAAQRSTAGATAPPIAPTAAPSLAPTPVKPNGPPAAPAAITAPAKGFWARFLDALTKRSAA